MQREVFTLRVAEGRSYREIAGIAGTTEGAARVHYHNALRAVKEFLMRDDGRRPPAGATTARDLLPALAARPAPAPTRARVEATWPLRRCARSSRCSRAHGRARRARAATLDLAAVRGRGAAGNRAPRRPGRRARLHRAGMARPARAAVPRGRTCAGWRVRRVAASAVLAIAPVARGRHVRSRLGPTPSRACGPHRGACPFARRGQAPAPDSRALGTLAPGASRRGRSRPRRARLLHAGAEPLGRARRSDRRRARRRARRGRVEESPLPSPEPEMPPLTSVSGGR
jgi:hypothetical protein